MLPTVLLPVVVAAARTPRPFPVPQPGRWHPSPALTTWRAMSVADIVPASARADTSASTTGGTAQETAELLRQRECYTSGATKSGGGRCKGGAPALQLQPRPLLYRPPPRKWGRGRGRFNVPLSPPTNRVPVLPATSARGLCEGGRGHPSVTTSSAPHPHATGLCGTSRPLLNCNTTLLSPYIPESLDPVVGRESPPLLLPLTALLSLLPTPCTPLSLLSTEI